MPTRILVSLVLSLPLIGAYAILSVGIVMIYRASGVLNLAHGAMMMIPPYVLYSLSNWGLPVVVALPLGLAAGAALGVAVERVFIRPLRGESVTAQTVGTVAALGLLIALAAKVWGTTPLPAVKVFPEGRISIAASSIRYGEIGLFVVMLVVTTALIYLFQHTDLGLLMRGTAENRRAASLMGVDPERITMISWALGGTLAALSGILLASITTLDPFVLALQALPGFVGALLGGLGALLSAAIGAAVVGVIQGLVPVFGAIGEAQGAAQLFLAILAIVVMATRGRSLVAGASRGEGQTGSARRARGAGASLTREARPLRRRPLLVIGIVAAGVFPWIPGVPFSVLGSANQAAVFALVAISLVVLTGWVGQISLSQAAFVGIGGYVTGWLAGGFGLKFPVNLPIAAAAAAAVAAVIGLVAVRVRGLYLAVATLIFAWMCDAFLFRQEWFVRHKQIASPKIGEPGSLPLFDFADRRIFYMVAWALAIFGLLAAANLRQSKTGRAFFAVQGSETAAASLGIDVVRYKLIAFSISGFLAGAAGNLIMNDFNTIEPDQFKFSVSFFFLSIAVVGGLRSLGGAIAAAMLFAGLNELFFRVAALAGYLDIVSTGLLAIVLLAYRDGLAAVPDTLARLGAAGRGAARALERASHAVGRARERVAGSGPVAGARRLAYRVPGVGRVASQSLSDWSLLVSEAARTARPNGAGPYDGEAAEAEDVATTPATPVAVPDHLAVAVNGSTKPDPDDRESRRPLIEAVSVTVRFGGLTAVSDASLTVREGEIVGLIGPNGAGKTTLFNSISGLNRPTEGRVHLFGRDVTDLPVHERAKCGIARTFQQIQLFGQLTVLDNLVVATHVHNETGVFSHLLATPGAVHAELENRRRAERVLDMIELHDVMDSLVADLPFGVLRMVEVARALVTGFPVIMLDEPASGLDNRETDLLAELLMLIRSSGLTLLLIEHDVKMVTSVSDYMYVLDQGQMIAQGVPADIKRDPSVIAAYLGTEAVEAPVA